MIERLAQQSQQIEVVLEVIHGIAEQTNLLATQAAVHQAEGAQAVRGRVEVIHAQAERAAKAVVATTAQWQGAQWAGSTVEGEPGAVPRMKLLSAASPLGAAC